MGQKARAVHLAYGEVLGLVLRGGAALPWVAESAPGSSAGLVLARVALRLPRASPSGTAVASGPLNARIEWVKKNYPPEDLFNLIA